jgi:hypothetical protein
MACKGATICCNPNVVELKLENYTHTDQDLPLFENHHQSYSTFVTVRSIHCRIDVAFPTARHEMERQIIFQGPRVHPRIW